jgi:NADP-dependent 3-hydroxy acid dehydrogenase YdfG
MRDDPMAEVVLITGCSSGIGEAAAAELASAGHIVYASARKPETLTALAAAGCRTLALDVTDEQSMIDAVRTIEAEHGAVDVLINNAGYGQYGPIEQVGLDDVRRQFETNVFGLVRLTQLVLPAMRAQRRGRVLNVSSMGGRTTLPGGGIYHGSKYAVEAISDALRREVKPFGIEVVVIEPGIVRTPWSELARSSSPTSAADDPYAGYKQAVDSSFARAYSGPLARLSTSAQDVAKVISKAVSANRPKTRYLISPMAKSLVLIEILLPDRLHDAVLKRQYKLP